ncbi:protein mono-ADP-ribosyltransferase PARP15-like isoform X2 [Diceros bicornis minor]|uniref:protein mono-ADP-ribosyltransferase PARP15-like isoform X2 n=1 Tax=Diceros bicornis minor TaxID=77932 RepID=UPI0026EAE1D0|nr:protein mono-ADP-ribosyltransferase PARP15-like isoform X2 [Diceros bicornis minor]
MSRDQGSGEDHLSNGNVIASTQTKEGLNLVLISGDVIYLRADVIVNTVPMNLQLGGGPLSQALLQKAGPMLQKELNATRQGAEEEVGSIFMTSGCDLDCKAVLHVVAPGWDNGAGSSRQIMANIIKKCLMNIEQLSLSSITFPMIGTGNLKFPKAVFAELILSEVFKFSSSEWLKTLQEVQFLVHPDDDESCQLFLDEFTRRSSRNPKESILMAGDTQGVSKAILEGAGQAVENECAELATRPHRDFIVTRGGYLMCKIIMHVLGDNDVRKTVSSVLEECEQRKYTSVSLPAIGTGNGRKKPIMVADDIINATADFAWKHSTPSLKTVKVVIFSFELLKVFHDSMRKREISTSPTVLSIVSKAAYDIPVHWTDMNQQRFCMIQLQPGESEYDTVKDKFSQTCSSYKIVKIERIQNIFLWQSYQIKKNHMDTKNGHKDNERLLFHGTDVDTVPHINQHGFNRSYAGMNAAVYGNGTYFAVDASYSANDKYSRPDSSGRKHIYVVRVLTGVYTRGHAGIITPPSKNPDDTTDLYDSVVDDRQHPKLFVVFSDNHAYPEYLITFTC